MKKKKKKKEKRTEYYTISIYNKRSPTKFFFLLTPIVLVLDWALVLLTTNYN